MKCADETKWLSCICGKRCINPLTLLNGDVDEFRFNIGVKTASEGGVKWCSRLNLVKFNLQEGDRRTHRANTHTHATVQRGTGQNLAIVFHY